MQNSDAIFWSRHQHVVLSWEGIIVYTLLFFYLFLPSIITTLSYVQIVI